jgi:hypothetical protein
MVDTPDRSQGSATLIHIDSRGLGTFVTANHVVDNGNTCTVTWDTGHKSKGTITGRDKGEDIAVIMAFVPEWARAIPVSQQPARQGADIIAIGFPEGSLQPLAFEGSKKGYFGGKFWTSGRAVEGMSGGGFIDRSGEYWKLSSVISATNGYESTGASNPSLLRFLGRTCKWVFGHPGKGKRRKEPVPERWGSGPAPNTPIDPVLPDTNDNSEVLAAIKALEKSTQTQINEINQILANLEVQKGDPGPAGKDGADGKDGSDGTDGEDGKDAELNENTINIIVQEVMRRIEDEITIVVESQ